MPDCQYIRYPQKEGESLIEETLYFDSNGLQIISLTTADGIPLKMNAEGSEVMVYAGDSPDLYWIDFTGLIRKELMMQRLLFWNMYQKDFLRG